MQTRLVVDASVAMSELGELGDKLARGIRDGVGWVDLAGEIYSPLIWQGRWYDSIRRNLLGLLKLWGNFFFEG